MRILVGKCFMLALVMLITVTFSEISGETGVLGGSMKRESARSVSGKQGKAREPRSVRKAKKQQALKEKNLKKEYAEFVRENRKRSYEIQTDEVKERMKANKKSTKKSYAEKKKKNTEAGKKASKKY
ncbi:MAG: hypothetical protein RBR81_01380 [Bacteroidales bacterium]|nr:hypothetical protein [Bacteroidales bacterium]